MKLHRIHQTSEERTLEAIQELNARLSGAETITVKGQDGYTPQKGRDYFTQAEINQLRVEIGEMVLAYVLPKIPRPRDGKSPIPDFDFPTKETVYKWVKDSIKTTFEQAKAPDYEQTIKLIKGEVKKYRPPSKTEVVKDAVDAVLKEVKSIVRKPVEWKEVKNVPDFQDMIARMQSHNFAGGGPRLRIQNGGTTISENITNLNFTGSGVSAAYSGNGVATLTVSGASGTIVDSEEVSGSGTTWTLANTPIAGTVKLYLNGMRAKLGASNDYTISGATITTTNSWSAGQVVADYRY